MLALRNAVDEDGQRSRRRHAQLQTLAVPESQTYRLIRTASRGRAIVVRPLFRGGHVGTRDASASLVAASCRR